MRIGGYALTLSPDGQSVAYTGVEDGARAIYLRTLDEFEVRQVTTSGQGPFFSPNGQWIGFFSEGRLNKVSVLGGNPVVLGETPPLTDAAWGPNDEIVVGSTETGLVRIPANGGEAEAVTTLSSGESGHLTSQFLPSGRDVLFRVYTGRGVDGLGLKVVSLDTGEVTDLDILGGVSRAKYANGHLIFTREDVLWTVPFDSQGKRLLGTPVPVLDDVGVNGAGIAQWDVSPTGTLVYVPSGGSDSTLAWVSRDGSVRELPLEPAAYSSPRLSPNGNEFAAHIGTGTSSDVWVFAEDGTTRRRLTDSGVAGVPAWTEDGRISYRLRDGGLVQLVLAPANGGEGHEVLASRSAFLSSLDWTRDGRSLAFAETGPGEFDLWVMRDGGEPEPLVAGRSTEAQVAFSPDARWFAFTSDETGRPEVSIRSYPETEIRIVVSRGGGSDPVWSRDGSELFFLSGDRLMVAEFESDVGALAGEPEVVLEAFAIASGVSQSGFDVAPDASQFLARFPHAPSEPGRRVNVVLNFSEELKARVPTP